MKGGLAEFILSAVLSFEMRRSLIPAHVGDNAELCHGGNLLLDITAVTVS